MPNPDEKRKQLASNMRAYTVMYLDIIIRSMIALIGVGVVLGLILNYFHIKYSIWIFVLTLAVTMLVSPLLAKVRLADTILTKYAYWKKPE